MHEQWTNKKIIGQFHKKFVTERGEKKIRNNETKSDEDVNNYRIDRMKFRDPNGEQYTSLFI